MYITLEEPTLDMTTETLKAGFYHSPGWNKDFPSIQLLTIEKLLCNAEVKIKSFLLGPEQHQEPASLSP